MDGQYNLEKKDVGESTMGITIRSEKRVSVIPEMLIAILPYELTDHIKRISNGQRVEEIRLRCDRNASITLGNRNVMLPYIFRREEMNNLVSVISNNSLYAYKESINSGYLTLKGGIRVGICGRATVEGEQVIGVYDISSLNIRIPATIRHIGEPVCRILRSNSHSSGILVYAPPGEGKTTLIASVCAKLAGGDEPWRICVVDTRGEFSGMLCDSSLCLDILSGYPRDIGIGIAIRTMNAELVICDEIGDMNEANAIISAQNAGASFLASAHGRDIRGLLGRPSVRLLHDAGVFSYYVGIKRRENGELIYTFNSREEANVLLYGGRNSYIASECT